MYKQLQGLHQEFYGWHGRLHLVQALALPLPPNVGSRLRVALLRMIGFSIGKRTVMWGMPTLMGGGNIYQRLYIGQECWFNIGCILELGANIRIGDCVALGPQVAILTTSHHIGDGRRRAGQTFVKPVHINDGAWLGARCTILPGVTIGTGAVVAAGATVIKDVPANTLVGGVPAVPIRQIAGEAERATILPAIMGTITKAQGVPV